MSITHTLTFGWTSGGTPLAKSVAVSSDAENNREFSVAGSTTNELVTIAWTNANLKSLYIQSDQTITIKTNSSGSPQETLTITANKPFVWYTGCGIANPFAGDVSAFYVTNGGSTAAAVSVRTLSQSTP